MKPFLCVKIQYIAAAGIDDQRFAAMPFSFEIETIALVDMAVRHDAWVVFIDQLEEGFKAFVRQICIIAQPEGRRMGQQDVKALCAPKPEKELAYPFPHLAFGVLMRTTIIAHAAAKAKDTNAFVNIDLVLDADTALRGLFFIFTVVIAVNIENGGVGKACEKG